MSFQIDLREAPLTPLRRALPEPVADAPSVTLSARPRRMTETTISKALRTAVREARSEVIADDLYTAAKADGLYLAYLAWGLSTSALLDLWDASKTADPTASRGARGFEDGVAEACRIAGLSLT